MGKMLILGSMVLSVLALAPYGFAGEAGNSGTIESHMNVSKVVPKVHADQVTVKTSWGQIVTSSATAPSNLKVGEEVDMQVSGNNAAIDVHRKGEKALSHRYLSGNLTYASSDKKEITLWTPEGEKTFGVQTGRSKLSAFEEGAPITIELKSDRSPSRVV